MTAQARLPFLDLAWEAWTEEVLADVLAERRRQVARYGHNEALEDGTGPDVAWLAPVSHLGASLVEAEFRSFYEDHEESHGEPTWSLLVREELAEAFAESDPERLEAELLQVAALCVSWVETLRRRT